MHVLLLTVAFVSFSDELLFYQLNAARILWCVFFGKQINSRFGLTLNTIGNEFFRFVFFFSFIIRCGKDDIFRNLDFDATVYVCKIHFDCTKKTTIFIYLGRRWYMVVKFLIFHTFIDGYRQIIPFMHLYNIGLWKIWNLVWRIFHILCL